MRQQNNGASCDAMHDGVGGTHFSIVSSSGSEFSKTLCATRGRKEDVNDILRLCSEPQMKLLTFVRRRLN